eukprot:TRINITY_DN74977_c0_g1_i1.p2 TRINITY_DN74977_c0_g1~~TRINITY_DN74977_c0_g1_i1.p2  ORF type:complete len:357 (+),score=172.65 TRINITY_DN74977_c0_g1_i1:71-1072(+)
MNPQDLFGMMGGMGGGFPAGMMGGMGGMGGGRRQRRGRDIGVRVPVKLELLYNGGVEKVDLPQTVLCTQCNGTGAKDAKSHECTDCQGRGSKIQRRMIGPGMVQQMQVPCDKCHGEGSALKDSDKCKVCNGQKVKEKERQLTVEIDPGMEDGTQIPFEGEGDQHPDIDIPGSIVVVLQEAEHSVFTRDGDDLILKKQITLQQALLGLSFELEHLDGRKLHINAPTGSIITPGQQLCVKGEGMPKTDMPGKGDLVVIFSIEFPRTVADDQIESFKKNLPAGRKVDTDFPAGEEPEECFMDDYTPEQWQSMGTMGDEEEEDAEEEGGHGVQCSHQ